MPNITTESTQPRYIFPAHPERAPARFLTPTDNVSLSSPWARLCLAVLNDAFVFRDIVFLRIKRCLPLDRQTRVQFVSDCSWMMDVDDKRRVLPFAVVCAALGLDLDMVRTKYRAGQPFRQAWHYLETVGTDEAALAA